MAELTECSDPPHSILPSSPEIANSVKTLDESSPTAPAIPLDDHLLSLSSPVLEIQNQASSPTKSVTQIQNPGESSSSPAKSLTQNPGESSSSPPDETLVMPSLVDLGENERRDSQIIGETQIQNPCESSSSPAKSITQFQTPGESSPSPAKSLTQIQNLGESPSSPPDETMATSSRVDLEENEHRDSQISPSPLVVEETEHRDSHIMQQTQISPANNNYDEILRIASTSYSIDDNKDSYNRRQRRYIPSHDYQSDDDIKIEATKPLEITWPYPKFEPSGVGAGLDNSGNTCFIASVLQCFTHTVPLLESLRSYNYQNPCNCGSERFCVLHALRDHIELALRSSGFTINIDRFRDNLNHFSSDFQINHQEDAHEFQQSFLDRLERCCLDPRNKFGSVSSQDANIVDHVFGGRLVSTLHCCNCGSLSETFEPSLGLSLEIEDVDDLLSALESFTRVEKLEDKLTCDNCKEKVSKEKQLKLDKLPLVATFHLKRFKNDGLMMEKIFKQVNFPLELDLFPYMSDDENPQVSTKYHLYAFVEHLGNGVSFGHYSSYVRSAPKTWHNFDDGKVTSVIEECVLTQNAYILFYAREGTEWFSTSFEEPKPMYEAAPFKCSPKSVLETTCSEEGASDHSTENVAVTNYVCNGSVEVPTLGEKYSDFCRHEPHEEEVYCSAESCSDDDYDDCYMMDAFESENAETSYQEEPNLHPAGNKAGNYDVSLNVLKTQKQPLSPVYKDGERALPGDTNRPVPNFRGKNAALKPRGSFEIQRSHLDRKRKQRGTHKRILAADPKGKGMAISRLKRGPSSFRHRMFAAALASSPIKKRKIRKSIGLRLL